MRRVIVIFIALFTMASFSQTGDVLSSERSEIKGAKPMDYISEPKGVDGIVHLSTWYYLRNSSNADWSYSGIFFKDKNKPYKYTQVGILKVDTVTLKKHIGNAYMNSGDRHHYVAFEQFHGKNTNVSYEGNDSLGFLPFSNGLYIPLKLNPSFTRKQEKDKGPRIDLTWQAEPSNKNGVLIQIEAQASNKQKLVVNYILAKDDGKCTLQSKDLKGIEPKAKVDISIIRVSQKRVELGGKSIVLKFTEDAILSTYN